ncbi:P-loop containing nucleoside triphosphate hydrolase protein [Aureobasidium sp. EXF-3400]|nr:P-loop containing nucleoside triphosphate hydrolase protein [Aureobasidium sp. EXF-3400]
MSTASQQPLFMKLEQFVLPRDTLLGCHSLFFSPQTVAAAILEGCSKTEVKEYLQSYDRGLIERQISDNIHERHSALFYAAKKNAIDIMELLLEYGADPEAKDPTNIPLLAVVIMWTKWSYKNVDKSVALLLSYGANPHCIPGYIWSTYIKMPAEEYSKGDPIHPMANWAKKYHRVVLEETANLTIRYHLNRASLTKLVTKRQRQLARLLGCSRMLHLPFHIVGQDHTLEIVMNKILAYDAMNRKRPLVLAFAGLSGHGKTELATSLGTLLDTDMFNIDMSKIQHPMSLIGAAAPFDGYEEGSPLDNHLADHASKRCVVFLDEFDKTRQEVRQCLLTILDSGVGMDLRSNTVIDVSKSIWILASNKGDDLISKFYDKNLEGKNDRERRQVSIKPLERNLSKLFVQEYTPAVAGRVDSFLPFFPFSRDEAAVVHHKFLRSLDDQIRLPIDIHNNPPRPVGHLHLSLVKDGDICKFLSENHYIRDLGARSIQNCVDGLADELFMLYTASEDEITEAANKQPHVKYSMQIHPVDQTFEVAIREDGTTQIPSD